MANLENQKTPRVTVHPSTVAKLEALGRSRGVEVVKGFSDCRKLLDVYGPKQSKKGGMKNV